MHIKIKNKVEDKLFTIYKEEEVNSKNPNIEYDISLLKNIFNNGKGNENNKIVPINTNNVLAVSIIDLCK